LPASQNRPRGGARIRSRAAATFRSERGAIRNGYFFHR
jgi:hypothetical protein